MRILQTKRLLWSRGPSNQSKAEYLPFTGPSAIPFQGAHHEIFVIHPNYKGWSVAEIATCDIWCHTWTIRSSSALINVAGVLSLRSNVGSFLMGVAILTTLQIRRILWTRYNGASLAFFTSCEGPVQRHTNAFVQFHGPDKR